MDLPYIRGCSLRAPLPITLPPSAICEALVGGDRGRRPGHSGHRAPARTDRRCRRHCADAAGTAAPGAGHPRLSKHPDSAKALWHALNPDASELTSYLVSFLVIAQFWMVHHRVLRGMRGHSEGLAWRNFSFLLALTLMPFTSDLIGRYGTNPVAITLFGLNLVAISLSTQWIFLYAAHHDLLVNVARSKRDERTARLRVVFVIGIVALSMALAGRHRNGRSSCGSCSWWSLRWPSGSAARSNAFGGSHTPRARNRARSATNDPSRPGGRLVRFGQAFTHLVARRVGRLLGHHVVDQVAERQVDVIEVEAPGRTERGRDDRAAVAGCAVIWSQVAPPSL